jgi:site-specific DNA recombinase
MQASTSKEKVLSTNTKQAIGYIRVSTDKQATEGVSLEAQAAKIRAWTAFNDYRLVAIHSDEGLSGSGTAKRPELQKALQAATKGTALVVYSLSRLSRSVEDTLRISRDLDKVGADLVSLSEKIDTTGAAGRMIFNMLAVLAQFERDQIAERTQAALRHKKATGKVYSPLPYGFEAMNGALVEVAAEADVVAEIVEARGAGQTLQQIANSLNRRGIPTKKGREWAPATIHYLIKRSSLAA